MSNSKRIYVLTDGEQIADHRSFTPEELEEANRKAIEASGGTWQWVENPDDYITSDASVLNYGSRTFVQLHTAKAKAFTRIFRHYENALAGFVVYTRREIRWLRRAGLLLEEQTETYHG